MNNPKTIQAREETEPLLGALLRLPHDAMRSDVIMPALDAAGYGDVRPSHFPILQALTSHPGGLRATELAEYAHITKQSMGYLVEHLSTAGYVERAPDPTDGRAKVVQLTGRGWDVIATIRAAVRQAEAAWGEILGAERVEQLRSLLQDLVAGLEARSANSET